MKKGVDPLGGLSAPFVMLIMRFGQPVNVDTSFSSQIISCERAISVNCQSHPWILVGVC